MSKNMAGQKKRKRIKGTRQTCPSSLLLKYGPRAVEEGKKQKIRERGTGTNQKKEKKRKKEPGPPL